MLHRVWWAMYRQIDRLEAEESLRLATVAIYPHAGKESARLWDSWRHAATGASERAVQSMRSQVDNFRNIFKRHGGGLGA